MVIREGRTFKSSWRKNVRILGGRTFGVVKDRLIWKLASQITRYGLDQSRYDRLRFAYDLLSTGKLLGFRRIVSALVRKQGEAFPALLTRVSNT